MTIIDFTETSTDSKKSLQLGKDTRQKPVGLFAGEHGYELHRLVCC